MGGTGIPGHSLVVNKGFDLFHSSGHEWSQLNLCTGNGCFMADPAGALTQPISG